MKMLKKTALAAALVVSTTTASYAEQVNIGDPGCTGATAIANLLAAVITDKMGGEANICYLYTSPSPPDRTSTPLPSSA